MKGKKLHCEDCTRGRYNKVINRKAEITKLADDLLDDLFVFKEEEEKQEEEQTKEGETK
jgi:hypothetical protein